MLSSPTSTAFNLSPLSDSLPQQESYDIIPKNLKIEFNECENSTLTSVEFREMSKLALKNSLEKYGLRKCKLTQKQIEYNDEQDALKNEGKSSTKKYQICHCIPNEILAKAYNQASSPEDKELILAFAYSDLNCYANKENYHHTNQEAALAGKTWNPDKDKLKNGVQKGNKMKTLHNSFKKLLENTKSEQGEVFSNVLTNIIYVMSKSSDDIPASYKSFVALLDKRLYLNFPEIKKIIDEAREEFKDLAERKQRERQQKERQEREEREQHEREQHEREQQEREQQEREERQQRELAEREEKERQERQQREIAQREREQREREERQRQQREIAQRERERQEREQREREERQRQQRVREQYERQQRQQREIEEYIRVIQYLRIRQYHSYPSYSFSNIPYYRHHGPRCKDGSLDMRFKVNWGHSKYG